MSLTTYFPPSATTPVSTPTDAAGYRAIWDANHPASYSYTIERTCFCLPLGPLTVTVVDGEVTSILTKSGKHLRLGGPRLQAYPITIDALFDYATPETYLAGLGFGSLDTVLARMKILWDGHFRDAVIGPPLEFDVAGWDDSSAQLNWQGRGTARLANQRSHAARWRA